MALVVKMLSKSVMEPNTLEEQSLIEDFYRCKAKKKNLGGQIFDQLWAQ